jgi:hypothetical protein
MFRYVDSVIELVDYFGTLFRRSHLKFLLFFSCFIHTIVEIIGNNANSLQHTHLMHCRMSTKNDFVHLFHYNSPVNTYLNNIDKDFFFFLSKVVFP